MYKKILVPLDGSKRAEAILPHVEEIARNFDAQVLFLQIIETKYGYASLDGFVSVSVEEAAREMRMQQAEQYLDRLVAKFREKGITAEASIKFSSIAHTILEVAEQEAVDLIALASHGHTGLARVFYGSVAASLIHLVDRPLLIVRAAANED